MMTKKDFKELADFCATIESSVIRERHLHFLCDFCRRNNPRFDEARFLEWVRRKVNHESTKGLG